MDRELIKNRLDFLSEIEFDNRDSFLELWEKLFREPYSLSMELNRVLGFNQFNRITDLELIQDFRRLYNE